MDIGKYKEQKEAGTARIIEVDGVLYLASRIFDQHTGKAQPSMSAVRREDVLQLQKALQAQLDSVAVVLADLDNPTKV